MGSYVTPKKNSSFIFFISLASQANPKLFQSSPTLAAGDVKVSIDGGAQANLATLPVVSPAGSTGVKVVLSAGEMNGDNIRVIFSDAAGAEWCDLSVSIQTSARQIDDLAFPATSGRSINVGTDGVVQSNLIQILASTLTETVGGYLAAAFKKLFDVAAPVFTTASVNQTGDSFARIGATGSGLTSLAQASVCTETRLAHLDADISSRMATFTLPANFSALVISGAGIVQAGLSPAERTAIANAVEAEIIDETDSEKVLTAITNKIAAVNPDLSGLTLTAIAAAVRTNLATELGRLDTNVGSRMATFTLPSNFSSLGITPAGKIICAALVDVCTANTDMRGTDGAALASSYTALRADKLDFLTGDAFARLGAPSGASVAADIAAVKSDTGNLVARISSILFAGITSLANWLRALARKTNIDATTTAEINATTGSGTGDYDPVTDSQQAIRDRGDVAWTTGSGGSGTGSGARTVTITVNDGSVVLEGAKVRLTKGAESYVGTTSAGGQTVFSLDDGTWGMAISLAGYQFTPTTLVVSGDTSHTYQLTIMAIAPSDPPQTTGFLVCYDEEGQPEPGVTISLSLRAAAGAGLALDTAVRTATSDSAGLVQFPGLFRGANYVIGRGTTNRKFTFTVPTNAGPTFEIPAIFGTP